MDITDRDIEHNPAEQDNAGDELISAEYAGGDRTEYAQSEAEHTREAERDRIAAERDAAEFSELWRAQPGAGMKRDQRRAKRALWAMMIVGIFVSAIAFAYKIAEFLFAINAEEAQGFADVPVTAYFFVAAGWIFILYWSFRSGQLRDAEKVKYDMLRQEEAYERAGQ